MFDRVALGEKLRALRHRTGMNEWQFAECMRTSRYHLGRAEIGQRVPGVAWMERFCEAAHTDLHFILEGITGQNSQFLGDEFISQIVPLLKNLTEYNRKIIIEVLQQQTQRVKPPARKHGKARRARNLVDSADMEPDSRMFTGE